MLFIAEIDQKIHFKCKTRTPAGQFLILFSIKNILSFVYLTFENDNLDFVGVSDKDI